MAKQANWYEEDVLLVTDNANREWLLSLAFQVEAQYKVRAEVDTGFMRNSTYVEGAGESTFTARSAELESNRTGTTSTHETINTPRQPEADGEVVIGVGADYAIYSELRSNALYQALEAVSAEAPAVIQSVGRRHFD